jgi:hypothetical protein
MRPLLLFVLLATPALAQGEPKQAMMAPDPACDAPAFAAQATSQPVQDAGVAPPFRQALFACQRGVDGPPKPTVRRT